VNDDSVIIIGGSIILPADEPPTTGTTVHIGDGSAFPSGSGVPFPGVTYPGLTGPGGPGSPFPAAPIGPGSPTHVGPLGPFPAPPTITERELDILVVDKEDLRDKVAFVMTTKEVTAEMGDHLRQMFGHFGKKHGMADVVVIPNARITFLNKDAIERLGNNFIDELKKL